MGSHSHLAFTTILLRTCTRGRAHWQPKGGGSTPDAGACEQSDHQTAHGRPLAGNLAGKTLSICSDFRGPKDPASPAAPRLNQDSKDGSTAPCVTSAPLAHKLAHANQQPCKSDTFQPFRKPLRSLASRGFESRPLRFPSRIGRNPLPDAATNGLTNRCSQSAGVHWRPARCLCVHVRRSVATICSMYANETEATPRTTRSQAPELRVEDRLRAKDDRHRLRRFLPAVPEKLGPDRRSNLALRRPPRTVV
jgi:hypothetical protein